eukprot:jgi/Chlat1/5074/Chrsp33S08960
MAEDKGRALRRQAEGRGLEEERGAMEEEEAGAHRDGLEEQGGGREGAGLLLPVPEDDDVVAAAVNNDELDEMDPDHPLLARAQAALTAQLQAAQARVEEALRERGAEAKVAAREREAAGVELYGVQQQLARLQLQLERAHEGATALRDARAAAEADLQEMRGLTADRSRAAGEGQKQVAGVQVELDRLGATLKQVEAYNAKVQDEIAVTRRATYAAEESVAKLEKDKERQDALVNTLQEQLKSQQQQLALHAARLAAQEEETRAARATLDAASVDMEAVNHEKRRLVSQWKTALLTMARRDETLQATEDAVRMQGEEASSLRGEGEGLGKASRREKERGEALAASLKKAEGEADYLTKQIGTLRERQERLQEHYAKLHKSLEVTEEATARARAEVRAIAADGDALEKQIVKGNREMQDRQAATTMEKDAQKTAQSTALLRRRALDQQILAAKLANEVAKSRVDILNTQAHIDKLKDTLSSLEAEMKEKGKTIGKYETEVRRRHDEIEKKTKEVDRLNRLYDKMTSNMTEENMGPLEATAANISRDITRKDAESRELQRRWVRLQTELVTLAAEQATTADRVRRLRSEHTVLGQKRVRLDAQHEANAKEVRGLDVAVDLGRLNEMIAKNGALQAGLANDNFNLETSIVNRLKDMEGDAARLKAKIDDAREEKRELAAESIEAERQCMLWERKIQLEKETQEALDPEAGNEIQAAMQKEIHRMKLRHAELLRRQEKLISDMERAIGKREHIAVAGRAAKKSPAATAAALKKAAADVRRQLREVEREASESEAAARDLERQREEGTAELDQQEREIKDLMRQEQELQAEVAKAVTDKMLALLRTTQQQRVGKRFEDMILNKQASDEQQHPSKHVAKLPMEMLDVELAAAEAKRLAIAGVVERVRTDFPFMEPALEKALNLIAVGV